VDSEYATISGKIAKVSGIVTSPVFRLYIQVYAGPVPQSHHS
jgi:hypothetical protein